MKLSHTSLPLTMAGQARPALKGFAVKGRANVKNPESLRLRRLQRRMSSSMYVLPHLIEEFRSMSGQGGEAINGRLKDVRLVVPVEVHLDSEDDEPLAPSDYLELIS